MESCTLSPHSPTRPHMLIAMSPLPPTPRRISISFVDYEPVFFSHSCTSWSAMVACVGHVASSPITVTSDYRAIRSKCTKLQMLLRLALYLCCVPKQFGVAFDHSCACALRGYWKVRTRLQVFINFVDERDTISILLLMGPG